MFDIDRESLQCLQWPEEVVTSQVCTEENKNTCCRKEFRKMNSAGLNVPGDSPASRHAHFNWQCVKPRCSALNLGAVQCVAPTARPKTSKHINTIK